MEQGVKHLVKCRCVLPQFEELEDPPLHQFVVFSVIVDDQVIPKYVQCNACDVVHKVTDICKSEIISGREHLSSVMTVDDIKMSLSEQLVAILEKHDVDYATWEQAKWIIENERWGEFIILSNEQIDDVRQVKYIRVLGKNLFQMNSHTVGVYI